MSEFERSAESVGLRAEFDRDESVVLEAAPAETAGSPVAAALSELDGLRDVELSEHPAVYQRIHAELQTALNSIDDA
jgi:hypothetical protein